MDLKEEVAWAFAILIGFLVIAAYFNFSESSISFTVNIWTSIVIGFFTSAIIGTIVEVISGNILKTITLTFEIQKIGISFSVSAFAITVFILEKMIF